MTVAILVALLAGALSLGVLSAVSSRRREEIELDDGCLSDEAIFALGGPMIDLEVQRHYPSVSGAPGPDGVFCRLDQTTRPA